jgi:hypothetical protein
MNRKDATDPLGNSHKSYLPDPDVLGSVAAALELDPELLLLFLDQQEHFTYQPTLGKRCKSTKSGQSHFKIEVGFDQGSRWMSYVVGEVEKKKNRRRENRRQSSSGEGRILWTGKR